ncbi:hypothetical protein [Actinokineospora sp.]|uniref:hypothetical protein n=1 Tax=Actinokineospora sp. TaxID=1872133 RepID=UPI003D6C3ADC
MTEYVVVARIPEGGLGAFLAYESTVLPLLSDHGGRLDRRVRSLDGRTEVHLLSFADDTGLTTYRADPRRAAAAHLPAASGATVELLPVAEVTADEP